MFWTVHHIRGAGSFTYLGVVPVMENVADHIGACALGGGGNLAVGGRRLHEVACDERDAVLHPLWLPGPYLTFVGRVLKERAGKLFEN